MILDSIANREIYEPLGRRFAAGLNWLSTFDAALGDGRIAIDGDDLFALVQSYATTPGSEKRFESHRRYADIQFVASGRERILHTDTDALTVRTEYDSQSDILFYDEPGASSSILLGPGHFTILWPGDAHKPGCMAGGRDEVKKVVIKVRL
jgi:YhcH/YjgK/YiaL family protein